MRFRVVKAFIVRDLKLVFSDRAIIFWMIIWPLVWIFMLAYVFVPPGSDRPVQLNVGVINDDHSNTTFNGTLLIKIMNETKYKGYPLFNVKMYSNETRLRNDLRRGVLDAGIIIPDGFGLNATVATGRLNVLIGARDPTSGSISLSVVQMFISEVNTYTGLYKVNATIKYIRLGMNNTGYQYPNFTYTNPLMRSFYGNRSFVEFLEEYMRGLVLSINASYEDVKPKAYMDRASTIGWYVIGAIGMMFLYSGFSYGASMVISEKESGTLKRLLATPIKESEYIVARILSGIASFIVSAIIAIVVGVFLTGAKLLFDPLNPIHWLVPVLIAIGAFLSIGFGIMLSLLARTSSGASGLGVALGLLLSFTAGIWFPSFMMPDIFKYLAMYFPVTWVMDAVRYIMVYERYGEALAMVPKILLATLAVLFIDWVIYRFKLRKYVEE